MCIKKKKTKVLASSVVVLYNYNVVFANIYDRLRFNHMVQETHAPNTRFVIILTV